MTAGPIPNSVKMSRNAIITVATAMVPNAAGDTLRASTAVMAREMNIPEYLATAIQNTPLAISCLMVGIA